MTDSEDEGEMTMIPVVDLEYIVSIADDALQELKALKKKNVWIEDPKVFELMQKLEKDGRRLYELLFEIPDEEPEVCCLHCGKCDGCDCVQQIEVESLIAYA